MNSETILPHELAAYYRVADSLDIPSTNEHRYYRLVPQLRNPESHSAFLKISPKDDGYTIAIQRIIDRCDPEFVAVPEHFHEDDRSTYLISAYSPYGDFRNYLTESSERTVTLQQCQHFVRQIAGAIKTLHHDCMLVHCDLKPSNILVVGTDQDYVDVRVNDFGNSLSIGSGVGSRRGYTLHYAAPELINPVVPLTQAVDYWAMGIILYEWLTGVHVFEGVSDELVRLRLATETTIDFSIVESSEIRALIAGLLQRNPDQRFDAEAIDAWLASDHGIISAGLRLAGEVLAAEPFPLSGRTVYSSTGLGEAVLRCSPADVFENAELYTWIANDLGRQDISASFESHRNNSENSEIALLEFAFDLYPHMPPIWRQREVSERNIIAVCNEAIRDEHSRGDSSEWVQSLVSDDGPLEFFIHRQDRNPRFSHIEKLAQKLRTSIEDYESSWAQIIENGAPEDIRPEESERHRRDIPLLIRNCCDDNAQVQLRETLAQLFDQRTLLFRHSWFFTFGTGRDLSIPKIQILTQLDQLSQLGVEYVNDMRDLQDIEEGSLGERVLFFQSQARLSEGTRITPGTQVTHLENGGDFFAEERFDLGTLMSESIGMPLQESWRFLLRWCQSLFSPGTDSVAENNIEEDHAGGAALSSDPDPDDIAVGYDAFIAPISPDMNTENEHIEIGAFLVRLSWQVRRERRLHIAVKTPGFVFTKPLLKLKNLPHEGHVLLFVNEDCDVSLRETAGFIPTRRLPKLRMRLCKIKPEIRSASKLSKYISPEYFSIGSESIRTADDAFTPAENWFVLPESSIRSCDTEQTVSQDEIQRPEKQTAPESVARSTNWLRKNLVKKIINYDLLKESNNV